MNSPHGRGARPLVAAAAAWLAAFGAGTADAQVLSTNTVSLGISLAPINGGAVGQQFTLLQGLALSQMTLHLMRIDLAPSASNTSLEIWQGGSDAALGSLAYTAVGMGSLPQPFEQGDVSFTFSNVSLGAGTYWVLLRTSAASPLPWSFWNGGIEGPSNAWGSINPKVYDAVGGFTVPDGMTAPLMLAIYGSAATPAVPEPATSTLGAGGAAAVLVCRALQRRRRTSAHG